MSATTDMPIYLRTLLEDLDKLLTAYGEKQGKGSLHKFRVSAKYTRSLYRFLATLKGGRKAESALADLRNIFAMAGPVREHQLLLQWMHVHRKPGLERHFSAEKDFVQGVGRLLKEIPGFLRQLRKQAPALEKLAARSTPDELRAYRSGVLDAFLARLEADLLPGRWHGARKRIKTLQHVQQWPVLRPRTKRVSAWSKRLDAFQVAVGAWHDTGDMIAWLHERGKSVRHDASLQQEWETALLLLERQYAEQYDGVKKELSLLRKSMPRKK